MGEIIPTLILPFILPVWPLEKMGRSWQITEYQHKLNQGGTPVSASGIEYTSDYIPFKSIRKDTQKQFTFTTDYNHGLVLHLSYTLS